MKPLLCALGLAAAVIFSAPKALAAEFRSGESVSIGSGEAINDDLYVAAGNITVDGTVNGDVVISGGQLTVNGKVNGDVIAAGGQITVNGEVADDVRAAGGEVTINNRVGDDILLSGGNVEIGSKAEVVGSTRVYAGMLRLAGKTADVDAGVGKLEVANTAVVAGNLSYMSQEDATIATGSSISGQVKKQQLPGKYNKREQHTRNAIWGIVLGTVMTSLFLWLLPNKATRVVKDMWPQLGRNLLWGFLTLIALPIAAVVFFMTVIGFPIGILLLLVYPIILGFGKLAAILAVGTWIERWWNKDADRPSYLAAFLGSIALVLLALIPVVGWFVSCIILLFGIGAVAHFDWDLLTHLRKENRV